MEPPAPGSVFAGYRIEAVAGRGGMGVVYRARQLRSAQGKDRPVTTVTAVRGISHRVLSGDPDRTLFIIRR